MNADKSQNEVPWPVVPWQDIVKNARRRCDLGCDYLEKALSSLAKNPDDPEFANYKEMLEKGELVLTVEMPFANSKSMGW